jgi:hypothetical protein
VDRDRLLPAVGLDQFVLLLIDCRLPFARVLGRQRE